MILNWLRKYRKKVQARDGRLHCAECARQIHKHDRYQILAVKHIDCRDRRLVGQKSLQIEMQRGELEQ